VWAAVVLGSLVLLLTLALCVPLDLELDLDTHRRPKFRTRLVWLFGLLRKEIGRRKKEPEKEEPEKKAPAEKEKRKGPGDKKTGVRFVFDLLRTRGLMGQIKRLVRDILGRIEVRNLLAKLRVGLGDPADTGLMWALIAPGTFLFNPSFPHRLEVEPSFEDEPTLEGYLHGTARVVPIRLVAPSLTFVFSLPAIRVVKKLIAHKWRRRR
jgi:hypothetical protein